jgi:hypothetical protein
MSTRRGSKDILEDDNKEQEIGCKRLLQQMRQESKEVHHQKNK